MPYKNKEDRDAFLRRRKQDNDRVVRAIKEASPCTDCGNFFPYYIMQFDHLHSKRRDVSKMAGYSRSELLAEIAKCELVCANCHAERTYQRRNALLV